MAEILATLGLELDAQQLLSTMPKVVAATERLASAVSWSTEEWGKLTAARERAEKSFTTRNENAYYKQQELYRQALKNQIETQKAYDRVISTESVRAQREVENARKRNQKAVEDLDKAHARAIEMNKQYDASLKRTASTGMNLIDVLAKIGLTMTAFQAVSMAKEILMLGARYETLGIVLETVGRNIGKTRAEMDGFATALQKTGITMTGSREELARMAGAQLDVAKAAAVARVAQNAAVIAGTNSSEAFERMITGITTQQPRVLRTLGIYVNFEAAQERAAKQMKKRVELLTAEEKIQINLQTALEGGAQVAGVYANAMDTAGKQVTSFVRYIQDLKTKLSEIFQPAFTAAVFGAAAALKGLGDYAKELSIVLAGTLLMAMTGVIAMMVSLIKTSVVASAAMTAFWRAALGPIGFAVIAIAALVALWYKFFSGIPEKEKARADAMREISDSTAKYTAELKKMDDAQLEATKNAAELNMTLLAGRQAQQEQIVRDTNKHVEDLKKSGARVLPGAPEGSRAAKESNELTLALREQALASSGLARITSDLDVATQRYGAATREAGKREEATAGAKKEARDHTREYEKALRDANEQLALETLKLSAGVGPALAHKRAIEDLTRANKLKADVIELNAKVEDKIYTPAQAAKLIEIKKRTNDVTAQVVAAERAYEDWLITIEEGTKIWDRQQKLADERMKQEDEEKKRIEGLTSARDEAVRSIQKELAAQQQQIAIASTNDAGRKKELEYLDLRKQKFEEYLKSTKVGQAADPWTANQMADEFVSNQRLLDALADKTEAWKSVLGDVADVAQSVAKAFGDVGKQIASAISAGAQLYEIFKKQYEAASKAAEAVKYAASRPNDAQAQDAAKAATSASNSASISGFASSLSVVLSFAAAVQNSVKAERERAAQQQKLWADFGAALSDFSKELKNATLSTVERARAETQTKVQGLVDKAQAASGYRGSLIGYAPTSEDLTALQSSLQWSAKLPGISSSVRQSIFAFADALTEIIVQAKAAEEALRKEQATAMAAATADLEVRRLVANGQTAEAEARRLQIAQQKEIDDAIAQFNGADGAEAYITALKEVQKAETDAAAAARALAAARKLTDLAISTQAFTDPRGASLARLDEDAARRYNDAADGAEKVAVALYNAAERADFFARQLENDTRVAEGFVGRVLATMGNDRTTQNYNRQVSQRQEIADAIRDGMSPSNLAMLEFTHRVENSFAQMQQAIEDGTAAINKRANDAIAVNNLLIDAIRSASEEELARLDQQIDTAEKAAKAQARAYDDQISAIREQTKAQVEAIDAQIEATRDAMDAAKEQLSLMEKQVQTSQQVVEAIKQFTDSLKLGDLSTLSPEGKLAEARRQFESVAAAAQGGDATAALALPNAATALLQASRAYNASNAGYVKDFARVNDVMALISQQFGATLPIDQQQLEAAKRGVEAMQGTLDALNKQKDAVQKAAEAQIKVLEKAKQQAADDAQKVIDGLKENRKTVAEKADEAIKKLEEENKKIRDAADAEIERLKAAELEAHNDRIRKDSYWETFLQGVGTGLAPGGGGNGPETLPGDGGTGPGTSSVRPVPLRTLDAAEATNVKLDTLTESIEALAELIQRQTVVVANANASEVNSQDTTTAAVQRVVSEVRQLGQALVARSR